MNAKFLNGIFAAIGALIGAAISWIVADKVNEEDRAKITQENDRLRQQIRTTLATFTSSNSKMEKAISDIIENPPESLLMLEKRLRSHGLTEKQLARILSAIESSSLYGED